MSSDSPQSREQAPDPIEQVSDGYLLLDEHRRVRAVNSATEDLFDVEREAVCDVPIGEVVPSLAESEIGDSIDAVLESGDPEQFLVYCADRSLWLDGRVSPTSGGISLVVSDVTERERTLRAHDRRVLALERLNDVASDPDRSRPEKIEAMLEVGVEALDASYGFLTKIDADRQEIEYSVGDHPELEVGTTAPLSETYCQYTLDAGGTLAISHASEDGVVEESAYERFGLECYLGAKLEVDGDVYGTVCFADREPREVGFDEHEQTLAELLTDWIRYLVEQASYQRELEQQQAFTESLMNSLPDILYAVDREGNYLRWNDRFETVTGYAGAEIRSMQPTDFVFEEDRESVVETFGQVWEGQPTSVEFRLETREGDLVPYEMSGAPLYDETGQIIGVTGVGRDITERKAHQERLSGILDTTQSLMQARDRAHVGELAANAAAKLLDESLSVFHLYDGDEERLIPTGITGEAGDLFGTAPVHDVGRGHPGDVFASGESRVVDDIPSSGHDADYGPARSGMFYPVGVHGTLSVFSTEPAAFDGTDERVLALLATSAAAACMRAKQMAETREARQHTERVLDRVNGLVENTVEVLVQAMTREELESGVISELAAADPYAFAWFGQPDVATETLVPSAWDGDASLPIEGRSFDLRHGGGPVSEAFREGTLQVRTGLSGSAQGPWADTVAGSDLDSLVVIPLVYKDATYGVLSVCAREGDVFDERERVVLEALGGAVANAINAVERGRILDATEIIELEFAVDDRDLLLSRLSAGAGGRLKSVGTDYRSDGSVRLYLSGDGVDPTDVVELAEQDPAVTDVTCVVEHDDECLLELIVEESLLAMLAEYGAVPSDVVAERGTTRFTVELPYETEARELFELVEDRYPGTDLLGYHERERTVETRQDFKAALSDRLTDRQDTALRTAYLGGFFDWPREVDGNELAGAMDISRPTYHQHLRTAQAKVFEELYE